MQRGYASGSPEISACCKHAQRRGCRAVDQMANCGDKVGQDFAGTRGRINPLWTKTWGVKAKNHLINNTNNEVLWDILGVLNDDPNAETGC